MVQPHSVSDREQVIDTMFGLARLSTFPRAIAALINSRESGFCLKVRTRLEQMGFRVEAGVRCQRGLVLSAYRRGFGQMENAA